MNTRWRYDRVDVVYQIKPKFVRAFFPSTFTRSWSRKWRRTYSIIKSWFSTARSRSFLESCIATYARKKGDLHWPVFKSTLITGKSWLFCSPNSIEASNSSSSIPRNSLNQTMTNPAVPIMSVSAITPMLTGVRSFLMFNFSFDGSLPTSSGSSGSISAFSPASSTGVVIKMSQSSFSIFKTFGSYAVRRPYIYT